MLLGPKVNTCDSLLANDTGILPLTVALALSTTEFANSTLVIAAVELAEITIEFGSVMLVAPEPCVASDKVTEFANVTLVTVEIAGAGEIVMKSAPIV